MLGIIKRTFYFPFASYFLFFAKIRLIFWQPRIVVITGSSGKTTLLHLIESQLGSGAKYSYHANSSFGIPFDILGLYRKNLTVLEWPVLFLKAPFSIFKKNPPQKIYVVEADCDRPGEGEFLSNLLKPEVTLWTNVSRTHSGNFDSVGHKSVDRAIAQEFASFAKKTSSLVIVNADNLLISEQVRFLKSEIKKVSNKVLDSYQINLVGTTFRFKDSVFSFPYLLPKELGISIQMALEICNYLSITPDKSFSRFSLPPGRSSFFKGIKKTTLIDSSYNANLDSMRAIINMFGQIKSGNKWVVLGDMLEQGNQEKEEHEKLADIILQNNFQRIILVGPRITKYTYPKIESLNKKQIIIKNFLGPKEVLEYLLKNIKGGEILLFKGARFLEGVVENLLVDKNQSRELARREKVWEKRRKKWGL